MDARFYNSEEININQLANDLENVYRAQGYQVQQVGSKDQVLVQLKKGGDFETLIGMGVALSVIIQRTAGGVLSMIGQQKWVDKAAAGAVGAVGVVFPVLLPLAVTAGVGALRQMSLANQVLNVVDGLVRQQRPGIQAGPVPMQLMPQVQQQWAPPSYSPPPPMYVPSQPQYLPPPQPQVVMSQPAAAPAPAPTPAKLRCPNCNTPYEAGDTFCTGCGKSLKTLCPNCQAELKPDASFCPKCGASTFQSTTATQTARPAPTPAPQSYTPTPVTYTQSTPTYTPPPAQPRPTPPQPQPYVPPVPQEPPVTPQPRVTIVPGTPSQQPPAAPKPPTRQEEPYYIPSKQPAPPDAPTVASTKASPAQAPKTEEPYYTPSTQASTMHTPAAQKAQTPAPKPIAAKPSSGPAFDPKATWGNLTFSDGKQVNLVGERIVVGRYDHDLGGINPDLDLAAMQGAETVSRIHAVFEHIGSTYTLMDLNSTNSTRINGKRLEPDKASPINDADTIQFGKVTCTFKKV